MLKKNSLVLAFLLVIGAVGYGEHSVPVLFSNNDILLKYSRLSLQQLLDTAEYYYQKNANDTALICLNLVMTASIKGKNTEQQKLIIEAHNKSAVIYYWMCDYRKSYELLIRALDLCEKLRYDSYKFKIHANIGNIYYRFNKYDMAKQYYSNALKLCNDSTGAVLILNNLGASELESGNMNSARYYLDQSMQISKRYHNIHLHTILNTTASMFQNGKLYDSAFHYFRLALNEAGKNRKIEFEAENLSGLGKLFFEINQTDSALHYTHASNTIAKANDFIDIMTGNYLLLSKIEESRGDYKNALEHFKMYAGLQDSVLDVKVFSDINQLQRLYEVSKTNEEIEKLTIEQQIKEQTIHYQKIIQHITWGVLLLVSAVLLFVFFQKRKLNKAYKVLFEKNMMIIDFQKNSSEALPEKQNKITLTDQKQNELLNKIVAVMEEVTIICDPEFSINKLVVLVNSNYKYVSQVINAALNKNFRSILNSYRIEEAQRLLSVPDSAKYTIETIAHQVGFKSRSAFSDAFKEVTGVSPAFYLKSMREQQHSA
ncbi:MAG: AraC family transcriptional regulator [Cytophagaceae bacterium]|jgi:AraC-like DNA-binding protein|nr:AraC family transcriptional regulator [Cytophagaceae bacterium]